MTLGKASVTLGKASVTLGKASRRMIFTICNLLYDEKKYLDLFKALITVGLLFFDSGKMKS